MENGLKADLIRLYEDATHSLLLDIVGCFMWIIRTCILSLATWRTERKIEWEVTFALRRTVDSRDFRARQFNLLT